MRRHIAGLPGRSCQIAVVKTNRPGKPRGRKKLEIRKECRTAVSPKTDTEVSTTLAISRRAAKAQPLATRKEARPRETMLARSHAPFAFAIRGGEPQERAKQ